jgi:hypothetical protein
MIDHATRIANVIKDELARQCAARGIGKDEAGYLAEFCFAPVVNEQGMILNLSPCVFVVLSLRRLLIGQAPVSGGLPVYGVLPEDSALREVVVRLVAELDMRRREEASTSEFAK